MVSRRKVVGIVGVGAIAALAYYYGPRYFPNLPFGPSTTTPATTTPGKPTTTTSPTTTPGKPTTTTSPTTTPVTTTTIVGPIPTTITPPQRPEDMRTPYLSVKLYDAAVNVNGDTTMEISALVSNDGNAPSFAAYVEIYIYYPETGYELFKRDTMTVQAGQSKGTGLKQLPVQVADDIWDNNAAITIRVMDPLLDPLREPIEERSRKVSWTNRIPSEFPNL